MIWILLPSLTPPAPPGRASSRCCGRREARAARRHAARRQRGWHCQRGKRGWWCHSCSASAPGASPSPPVTRADRRCSATQRPGERESGRAGLLLTPLASSSGGARGRAQRPASCCAQPAVEHRGGWAQGACAMRPQRPAAALRPPEDSARILL